MRQDAYTPTSNFPIILMVKKKTLCVLITHHLFAPLRAKKGYMLKVKC